MRRLIRLPGTRGTFSGSAPEGVAWGADDPDQALLTAPQLVCTRR